MGKEDSKTSIEFIETDKPDTTEKRGSAGDKSTADSETDTRRGRGKGRSTDTTNGTEKTEVQSTKVSVLDETKKEETKTVKKTVKRKPRKVTKKKKETIDNTQLNVAIMTISTIVASRPHCGHWQLSEEETNKITLPLCEIIKEHDIANKIGSHSNQIALSIACLSVFVPRILQSIMIYKERKKANDRIKKSIKSSTSQEPNHTVDREDVERPSANDKNNSGDESWLNSIFY